MIRFANSGPESGSDILTDLTTHTQILLKSWRLSFYISRDFSVFQNQSANRSGLIQGLTGMQVFQIFFTFLNFVTKRGYPNPSGWDPDSHDLYVFSLLDPDP
jgi:hypothetical protein